MADPRHVRALATGTAVVRIVDSVRPAGGWLSTNQPPAQRDRVGRQASTLLDGHGFHTGGAFHNQRLLTPHQLWTAYQRVPDVRAAIDAIVRRVATWDWNVVPTLDPKDPGFEEALNLAEEQRRFLSAPNTDGETWQELWTKVLIDQLVFDAGVIENVFDSAIETEDGQPARVVRGDELEELVALRGANVLPIVDQFGRVLGYRQEFLHFGHGFLVHDATRTDKDNAHPIIQFEPEQIVYMRMFPNTSSPLGVPLIETVVNEIITMMRQSEHSMLAFDVDEIPPGIVVLTGLAGQAAEDAVADLQNMRGKDHKIRVVTSADPTAGGAKWVEFRHKAKDVDFVNVVDKVRRTIWRVFGVLPVEMGSSEDIPRAVGQVQLEVSASHLINPLLELIEGKVNARILPLSVGDPDAARTIKFIFDREQKLSPEEQLRKSESLVKLVDAGLISRNEGREELGRPPIVAGDAVTVSTPQGPLPLAAAIGAAVPTDDEDGGQPTTPSGGVDEPGAATPDDNEEAPGEAEVSLVRHRHGPNCGHDHIERQLEEDLPSEWQPRGMFRGFRTLNLLPLWESTAAYKRAVEPLYDRMANEITAAVVSLYSQGATTQEAADEMDQRIALALSRLAVDWSLVTAAMYRQVAKNGRDTAADFTGLPVLEDWEQRAQQYGERAMQFLDAPGGLLSDIRASLQAVTSTLVRGAGDPPDTRAVRPAPIDLGSDVEPEEAVAAAAAVVANQKHRIVNWSGRLVELANQTLVAGMLDGSTIVDPAGEVARVEWWAEWINVGDNRMCITCALLGSQGFVPLETLPTVPGGDTECRARCRCVLQLVTRREIEGDVAVLLGGGNA